MLNGADGSLNLPYPLPLAALPAPPLPKRDHFYSIAVLDTLVTGIIEWAGHWPESLKIERGGMPKVIRP